MAAATANILEDLATQVRGTARDCEMYRKIAAEKGYNFDQTIKESTLEEIPYVSWAHFKASNNQYHKLLRIPLNQLERWELSSSTTGDPSVVGRGPSDVAVFLRNYNTVFEDFSFKKSIKKLILFSPSVAFLEHMPGEWQGKRGFLFYLDIANMWKGYDINYLLKFKMPKAILYMLTHFKMKAFIEIDGKLLESSLIKAERDKIPTLVANSVPLMYQNFLDYQKKKKRTFNMPETFRIQTGGGGWGGVKGQVKLGYNIDKADFYDKLGKFFNLPITNFADCFGATETPIACGGHWSKKYNDIVFHLGKDQGRIILRDVDTLERIKTTNTPGALEILTPYGVDTYAGVSILLDDLAEIVDFNRCDECGREGTIFRITGRLTPEIGKGCTSFYNLTPYKGV
ncbi:MAG: acyl-protein synthetase, LuxE [Promethearchaeota archaeon CR_4]|nr:MAG: acyl-protein synthetase, LuxE [Candidatus Lokiarchaeota archaeon CR_4]